jgi:hypothetical protein
LIATLLPERVISAGETTETSGRHAIGTTGQRRGHSQASDGNKESTSDFP